MFPYMKFPPMPVGPARIYMSERQDPMRWESTNDIRVYEPPKRWRQFQSMWVRRRAK